MLFRSRLELKPIRAAERLGLTTRQVRRLARRYAAAGPVGLISKRFSRPSNNRLHDAIADQVIKLLRSTYADFGPTLAAENAVEENLHQSACSIVDKYQCRACGTAVFEPMMFAAIDLNELADARPPQSGLLNPRWPELPRDP